MSKRLPFLLLACFLFAAAFSLHSQNFIQQSFHEPQIGDQVVRVYWENQTTPPQFNGANSSWTYNLQLHSLAQEDTVTYVPVPLAPPSGFPNSNILAQHRFKVDQWNYWQNFDAYFLRDSDGLWFEGYAFENGGADNGPSVFSQLAPRLIWPFAYGDTYVDTVGAVFYGFGAFRDTAETFINAVGQGTLILNGATYNNVLCIHDVDSLAPFFFKPYLQQWSFYTSNRKYPLLTIQEFTANDYLVFTTEQLVASITDPLRHPFSIHPNPSREMVRIKADRGQVWEELKVYDSRGQLMTVVNRPLAGGQAEIDVREWIPGIYLVVIKGRDGKQTVKKLVKH